MTSYDAWKTTPPEDPEQELEDRWGFDTDRENEADYYEDEQDAVTWAPEVELGEE